MPSSSPIIVLITTITEPHIYPDHKNTQILFMTMASGGPPPPEQGGQQQYNNNQHQYPPGELVVE